MKEVLLKVFRLELTLWVLLILSISIGGARGDVIMMPVICTLLICITYLKSKERDI
jgi:hypothetical protein